METCAQHVRGVIVLEVARPEYMNNEECGFVPDEHGQERKARWFVGVWLAAWILVDSPAANAADLEQTLRNLVTAFTGRLLPILAMGYLGKNIFAHVTGDPNARNDSVRVVIATACLLGLAGVWSFIQQQAR